MYKKFIIYIILFICSISAYAQNSKRADKEQKRQEEYQKTVELIDSNQYEFIGQKANTQKGRMIDLTTRQNYLRITNNSATADMPYFGRAYSGGYSTSDGGIQFDNTMEGFSVQKDDKKRRITIRFNVNTPDDNFDCTLVISSPGNATFSINSNKKQGISYLGSIGEITNEEK